MTKARDIADFKFENIVDTGTEGTKVASGTTAQRGSTTGQWRYNTDTGFFEGRNTNGTFSTLEPSPTIISTDITDIDTATGGNITIRVTGTNFTTGGTIKFRANDNSEITATTSTFINTSNYDAVVARSSFTNAKEPYDVQYTSSSGLIAILENHINVDNSPVWSTASGQIGGNLFEGVTVNTSVTATDSDGDTIAYSVTSGALPSGLSLNSSTGAITGTPSAVSADTTSSFTLRATANSKTADRAFSIIIKNDLLNVVDFFGDNSGKSLYRFESNGTDSGGVGNMTFTHAGGFAGSSGSVNFQTGYFGNGVFKNYASDYGQIASRSYSNFTVNMWCKFEDLGSNDQTFKGVFGHQETGQMIVVYNNSAYRLAVYKSSYSNASNYSGGDRYTAEATGCPSLSNNTWAMLTWSKDGTDTRLYVNGVLGNTWNEDISTTSLVGPNSLLYMGTASSQLGNATYDTKGTYDHLRIFDKKLSQSEITTLYNFESTR